MGQKQKSQTKTSGAASGYRKRTELTRQDELVDVIWADLYAANFHSTSETKTTVTIDGALEGGTTLLRKEFLAFIADLD